MAAAQPIRTRLYLNAGAAVAPLVFYQAAEEGRFGRSDYFSSLPGGGRAAFIANALGDIARAKGMTQVARDAGLSRESLYKALSGERSPDFDTILKVVGALGLQLRAVAAQDAMVQPVGPADPRGLSVR